MRFKKLLALIYFFIGITSFSYSQEMPVNSFSRNAVFFEAGGNGGAYSLNYDRIFFSKNKYKVTARGGFGFWPGKIWDEPNQYYFISELNLLHGKSNKFFETGLGLTFLYEDYPTGYFPNQPHELNDSNSQWLLFFRIGYRFQEQKGFFFRAALTPATDFGKSDWPLLPWAGFSFGKTF